jgi:hypothetical protein
MQSTSSVELQKPGFALHCSVAFKLAMMKQNALAEGLHHQPSPTQVATKPNTYLLR